MAYAGWSPEYRLYQQGSYTAIGGETTLPNKASPESVLFKNGKILLPSVDYVMNNSTGAVTLTSDAVALDVYQLLNLSTFHASDTYPKNKLDALLYVNHVLSNSTTTPSLIESSACAIDCTSGISRATLPLNPKVGCIIYFYDLTQKINNINKFIVVRPNSLVTIMGIAEDMDVSTPQCQFKMSWTGSDWRII